MLLSAKTKIDDLLKKYPFLLDYFVSLSPAYNRLKNPLLRKTLGKLANLSQVAAMGEIPLDKLLHGIKEEIRRQEGQEVGLESGEEISSTAAAKEDKIEILKGIIRELHAGGDLQVLKRQFAELVRDVSPGEIAEMEQRLIAEGMPEEEVKRLCDVHVLIFQESLEEQPAPAYIPGHPLHTLTAENRAAEKIIAELEAELRYLGKPPSFSLFGERRDALRSLIEKLAAIEKHYLKKENQLFPRLEAHGVSGPSKVMWAIHDDIRAQFRLLREVLMSEKGEEFTTKAEVLIQTIKDMIYKEEKILFPMSLEVLDEADWAGVKEGEEEIGYAWVTPGTEWKPQVPPRRIKAVYPPPAEAETYFDLDTGNLTPRQINAIFKHLPVDITFVDENDVVRFYSQTRERIFPRSPGVIGRQVQNCHPPKSIHLVNRILEAFKKGERDVAEFWIQREGKFIHIRYFALRDEAGKYLGCIEVTQDVTAIRKLEGERRLLDWI